MNLGLWIPIQKNSNMLRKEVNIMNDLIMEIVSSMGISWGVASKVIDLVLAGSSAWAIVATIVSGGGIVAIGAVAVKALIQGKIKQIGHAAVISW